MGVEGGRATTPEGRGGERAVPAVRQLDVSQTVPGHNPNLWLLSREVVSELVDGISGRGGGGSGGGDGEAEREAELCGLCAPVDVERDASWKVLAAQSEESDEGDEGDEVANPNAEPREHTPK